MTALLLLLACTGAKTVPTETGGGPDTLSIPDYSDVDLPTLYVDALKTALATDLRAPWAGEAAALSMGVPSCPNVFAGVPDLKIDGVPRDARGWSWSDHCLNGPTSYGGWTWWQNSLTTSGDASSGSGATTEGARDLSAVATVSQGNTVLFEFDGTGSDALTLETAPDYTHWSYSSTLDATATGNLAFPDGSSLAGGWRSNVYQRYAGGDVQTLEIRGNVYMFDARLQTKFDSVAVDLTFQGPLGAAPTDCTAEPKGTLSVRDTDADWFDIVFEPIHADTASTFSDNPYTSCDGCGNLYVRGIDQGVTVCPDFSFLWDDGALAPPATSDFAYSIRDGLPP